MSKFIFVMLMILLAGCAASPVAAPSTPTGDAQTGKPTFIFFATDG